MIPPSAILVVAPHWIGDAVMSQGLLQVLRSRWPEVAIDVLAPPPSAAVFGRMAEVRHVLVAPFRPGRFDLLSRIKLGRSLAGQYGAAYVLPGSWKSAVVPYAARIPRRTGYLREVRWGLLNDIAVLPEVMRRRTALAFQALGDRGVLDQAENLRNPRLVVDRQNCRSLLSVHGLVANGYVVLCPGAEFGPAKRWPSRHWATLAERAAERGFAAVLIGSGKDQQIAREIAAISPSVRDLTGRTSMADAIDLIACARITVANDSGLLHVAAAVECPVLGLYGSTSPTDAPPLADHARALSLHLPCAPCRKRDCPLGHKDCLEKLAPSDVQIAVDALERHHVHPSD